ncbi:hypothetical protein DFH09DRAFT_1082457 [Mycena vulgaris]|nr:hypothetical protein DFH09DRAFT_1082457 [Mycena vulgaris]
MSTPRMVLWPMIEVIDNGSDWSIALRTTLPTVMKTNMIIAGSPCRPQPRSRSNPATRLQAHISNVVAGQPHHPCAKLDDPQAPLALTGYSEAGNTLDGFERIRTPGAGLAAVKSSSQLRPVATDLGFFRLKRVMPQNRAVTVPWMVCQNGGRHGTVAMPRVPWKRGHGYGEQPYSRTVIGMSASLRFKVTEKMTLGLVLGTAIPSAERDMGAANKVVDG